MVVLLIVVAVVLVVVAARDRAELRRRIDALERAVTELRLHSRRAATDAPTAAHPAAAPVPPPPLAPGAPSAPASAPPLRPAASRAPIGAAAAARTTAELPRHAGAADPLPERHREVSPAEPEHPVAGDPLLPGWLRDFFSGGNLIVRVGVIVLFFGVAFLLRYAAEHSHLSIEWRLTGVAVAGVVLLGLGWRLRGARRGYALALQSAGVGVLYLTVFAAFRLFSVLPSGAAFALLAAIAALSAALAILEDSLAFAMLGTAGGFLAPVLASTTAGHHVALFSYFAVLDLAVVAIAWFRAWRPLNLLAFLFTYGIGTVWGVLKYQPPDFATTEPFVVLFFLMFVAIAVLFALKRAPQLEHYVDGTLIFGTPVVSFGLQAGLVREMHYGLAYSALALGGFYLVLARLLHARRRESLGLLVESFLALGVAFITLAVPFALEGRWTAATWALEGAAVLWIGLRQQRTVPVAAGLVLQLMAAVAYFWEGIEVPAAAADALLLNSRYLGAMLIGSSGILIAARLRHTRGTDTAPWYASLSMPLLGWGILWWLASGFWELERHVAPPLQLASGIVYTTGTAILTSALGARLAWRAMRGAALLLVPGLVLFALAGWNAPHPFAAGGWWAWPIAVLFASLVLLRDESVASGGGVTALHTLGLWLVTYLATAELAYQAEMAVRGSAVWPAAVRGLVPALAVFAATRGARRGGWPFGSAPRAYSGAGAIGLAAYLLGFVVYSAFSSNGAATPLAYVPLLNPMDLTEGFALLALVEAARAPARAGIELDAEFGRAAAVLTGAATFVWLNALALRTLHHYAGVPYTFDAIVASTLAQTTLTIFWTVLALLGMAFASRSGRRLEWMAGAVLLALVIVKLVLVDLSRTGTVPRIISFLGVGALMLVIGYLSPLPPAPKESADGA
jgi:uncharacterized membrane protein